MMNLTKTVLMSSILFASATAVHAQWEWNFLVGASAGYADRDGDFNFSTTAPAPGLQVSDVALDHSDNGFIWGVLGGLQAHCNNWLFGAELNVDWHDFDDARHHTFNRVSGAAPGVVTPVNATARFDRGTVVGLSARAGYQMAPYLMPYIRLGAETSNDEYTVTGAFAPANVPLFTLHGDRRTYRFLGGVGVEIPIPSLYGLSVRAEYNYHSKGKVVDLRGTASDGLTYVQSGMKPRTHSGKASLVYNFL